MADALRSFTPYLACFDAVEEPLLSAETYVIQGREHVYLFDTGHGSPSPETLNALRPEMIFISHFHEDHMGNLKDLACDKIAASAFTERKAGRPVRKPPFSFEDGIAFSFESLPSSHVSGACMLTLDRKITLLGDGAYSGKNGFNVSVLKQTIDALKAADTEFFLCSHRPELIPKAVMLRFLQSVYAKREKGAAYIAAEDA